MSYYSYKIPAHERDGIGLWFNIYKAEDMWFKYSDHRKEHNEKRKLRLHFNLKILIWQIHFDIPLKLVGNTYYGRKMKDV